MKTTATKFNHIEAAIMHVRASGPVTRDEIAGFIREQVIGATEKNCCHLAEVAVAHGLSHKWLAVFDKEESIPSYVIA